MKNTMKKVFSVLLAVLILLSIVSMSVSAATTINYSPYPKVEYNYSSSVTTGTIRYIAQNSASSYFNWNYWPRNSFGGYGSPESECGTACISMALSYVGIDRTPKVLLESTNGYTGSMWGQQGNASSKSISKSTSAVSNAMNDYINGNGKYSPLCVYIVPFSSTSSMHWILLVGKIDNNKYLALNPWHTSGTNGTFVIQINGTTNPISSINQWYNPKASINNDTQKPTTILHPTSGTIVKFASGVGNNMYLAFALSNNNVQIFENGDSNSSANWVKSQYFKLTHIGDGWYTIVGAGNGKAMDVYDWCSASGTNIQQWDLHKGDNQLFRFYDAGNGYCYIKSKLGTYVDVQNGDNVNRTNVWAYSFNGSNAQKWKITNGSGLESISSCDDAASTNDKHYSNTTKLRFSGWAFSNKAKKVTFKYILDSNTAVSVNNVNRGDVKNAYPNSCSFTDVGYDFSLDLSKLSIGKHTIKVIATSTSGETKNVSNLCFYVDKHTHSYTSNITTQATFIKEGVKTFKCSCGDSYTEKIAKKSLGTTSKITSTKTSSSVTLTWNKVTDAIGYRVFQKVDGKWKKLTDTTKLTYTVNSLKANTAYTFAIRAYVVDGNTKVFAPKYKTLSVTTSKTSSKPDQVKNVKATPTSTTVKLTWSKVSNVKGYYVFSYNSSTKKYTSLGKTTGTSYTIKNLKANTNYQFAVQAYKVSNSKNVYGKVSSVVKVTTLLAAPTLKVTSTVKGKANLTWTNIAGESGYAIYMSTKKDSGFTHLYNYKANSTKDTKTSLVSGKTYYFKVRAYKTVNGNKTYGDYSAVKSVKIK